VFKLSGGTESTCLHSGVDILTARRELVLVRCDMHRNVGTSSCKTCVKMFQTGQACELGLWALAHRSLSVIYTVLILGTRYPVPTRPSHYPGYPVPDTRVPNPGARYRCCRRWPPSSRPIRLCSTPTEARHSRWRARRRSRTMASTRRLWACKWVLVLKVPTYDTYRPSIYL